ncbi:hypothetical protein REPUB_Repub13aG0150800 [Reevesia pubescens]
MREEEWVKEAMADAMLVAEVLLSLVQAESPPSPPPDHSAKNNTASSPALQLEWSVRQRRSRQALRKKGETARASPTTPLSWSGGTSVSGGAGVDGSEESSRPPSKPVDNARSKVPAATETNPPKRSRRKKTLAELKEDMSSHLKENKSLKNELEMVKLKFENLRTTNEALSRKLKFEKERATNESSKRMKIDYQSYQATETAMAFVEPKNAISDLSQQREVACPTTSDGCKENAPYMPNGSNAQDVATCETSFVLPDLNLPIEDEVLHGIS